MSADLGPLDVTRPLTADERAGLLLAVIRADEVLQFARGFLDVPVEAWPEAVLATFSRTPVADEQPAAVLRRWWLLFREDLDLVHEVRNRVVHQVPVSDSELTKVGWLARHLEDVTDPDRVLR